MISLEREKGDYFLNFLLITDEDSYGTSLDSIQEKIYLPNEVLKDIFEKKESISFFNNEKGRENIFTFFLGENGLIWKKENEICMLQEELSSTLNNKEKKVNKSKI